MGNKSVFEDGPLFALGMKSILRPVGNKGLACEILIRTSASAIVIYGLGNSNAGADDLKVLKQIVGCVWFPLEDAGSGTDDTMYQTIATDENTDDMVTITVPAAKAFFLIVFGYPEAA